MDVLEAEPVDKAADMFGDDDGLLRGDGAEGFAVEVVEVGVFPYQSLCKGVDDRPK